MRVGKTRGNCERSTRRLLCYVSVVYTPDEISFSAFFGGFKIEGFIAVNAGRYNAKTDTVRDVAF